MKPNPTAEELEAAANKLLARSVLRRFKRLSECLLTFDSA